MSTLAGHLTVSELRERIARLEGRGRRAKSVLPSGIPDLGSRLPGCGLALGALHEVAGGGNGAVDGAAAQMVPNVSSVSGGSKTPSSQPSICGAQALNDTS